MRPAYLTCTRRWTCLNASRYSLAMLDPAPSCQPANGHGARPGGVRVFASSRRVSPDLTRPRRGGRIRNPERRQCGGLFVPVRPYAIPRVVTPRGFDLFGTLAGAGGIGGLLARSRHATSSPYAVNGNSFYHADGNGNVTYLANSSGGTDAAYRYDPFGRWLAQTGPYATANGMRTSSKPWIAHNGSNTDGLHYYGYRFYDPLTQRWLNRDPLGEFAGLNLYRFVDNNPINLFDPDGHDVVYLLDPSVSFHGHAAILIGNDQNGWHYFSFGMGECWFNPWAASRDNLEYIGFKSFDSARRDARLARYENYARWHTDRAADQKAINKMREYFNKGYFVCGNNCDDAAANAIRAAGVDFDDRFLPTTSFERNRGRADESGTFPLPPAQPRH